MLALSAFAIGCEAEGEKLDYNELPVAAGAGTGGSDGSGGSGGGGGGDGMQSTGACAGNNVCGENPELTTGMFCGTSVPHAPPTCVAMGDMCSNAEAMCVMLDNMTFGCIKTCT